jgi:transposase InsO family protein
MVGMVHSTYYRTPSMGLRGKKPSEFTCHYEHGFVREDVVIESIKKILSHPFIDCGYHLMTRYLNRNGYVVNHKKVYRIMKEANMIRRENRINRSGSGRQFLKFRKVITARPFECIAMDIKYVWIPETGKNAYLLSVIEVHTRRILLDLFAYSVKKKQVINLLSELFMKHEYPESVVIRSDNGSQFIAKDVRVYPGMIGVSQEFTHIATPEENAHIEAYHGILKKEVFMRFEYTKFGEIEKIIKNYVWFYNNDRLHVLLGKITPMEKWNATKHLIKQKELVA